MNKFRLTNFGAFLLALGLVVLPTGVQAQIAGTVTDALTGEPVSGVQVFLESDQSVGVLSNAEGSYTLQGVAAGTYTVVAQRLGYQTLRQEGVQVTAGAPTTLALQISEVVLQLQGIVATGLVDPVDGARSPISVARVNRDQMPVTVSGPALQNLQGQIAGLQMARGSGQPGDDVTLMLRSPTSIRGGANEPLIVVDGVVLGNSTTDISAYDIESVEVVRGAAAASLYGSQAAAGVIAITTNRGSNLELGTTRFTLTNEYGFSSSYGADNLVEHHFYKVDDPENPTAYLDSNGNPTDERSERALDLLPGQTNTRYVFMDNEYVDGPYDNFGAVLTNGAFSRQGLTLTSNQQSTNLAISLNRERDQGNLRGIDGYTLNSFRVNVDHRFRDNLSLNISSYYSRDYRDSYTGAGVTFASMTSFPVDIDITQRNPDTGEYLRFPDPQQDEINPLWEIYSGSEGERRRQRTLASTGLRWQPASWVDFRTLVSYDRRDTKSRSYTPKGLPSGSIENEGETGGSIDFDNSFGERWNAEAKMQLRRNFGELNVRATGRAVLERERNESTSVDGNDFLVEGIPQINATLQETRSGSSSENESRAIGYLANLAFDYQGKYILETLVRYDGSSRFGSEERWHPYYRASAAWRLGEEDFFNIPNIDEFKLRFARGTAGGRPSFSSQYETWNLGGGVPSKGGLGNINLKPEDTTEHEVGLEMIVAGRLGLEINYAWQRTEDQLYRQALPAFLGFSSQWVNGGTIEGNTIEVTLDGQLFQTPAFGWHSTLVGDYSRAEIKNWPFQCSQNNYVARCDNTDVFDIYARSFVNDTGELATHLGGLFEPYADQFQTNDDGLLVWVGEGGSYTDMNWGTFTEIEGEELEWGMPFVELNEAGNTEVSVIGNAAPINLGWTNNFRYNDFTLHLGMNASLGGEAVNFDGQGDIGTLSDEYLYRQEDQFGKPDYLKKPLKYYVEGIYAGNVETDWWVEDASYLKLRTASLTYTLTQERLNSWGLSGLGIQNLRLAATALNLFTLSSWSGWDPELAINYSALDSVFTSAWPPTSRYSFEVQATF